MLVELSADDEIPARHKDAIDKVSMTITDLKAALMERQLSANLESASSFSSKEYTGLIAQFKDIEASWKLSEYAGKKRKPWSDEGPACSDMSNSQSAGGAAGNALARCSEATSKEHALIDCPIAGPVHHMARRSYKYPQSRRGGCFAVLR